MKRISRKRKRIIRKYYFYDNCGKNWKKVSRYEYLRDEKGMRETTMTWKPHYAWSAF